MVLDHLLRSWIVLFSDYRLWFSIGIICVRDLVLLFGDQLLSCRMGVNFLRFSDSRSALASCLPPLALKNAKENNACSPGYHLRVFVGQVEPSRADFKKKNTD